ncbi:hypothetical protein EDD86DRAFT_128463 [Gorgonomyces haynaldii]|nr:hypothetical protein EDD86DRAFT_128463 [Gorgonomyces haynaldii]
MIASAFFASSALAAAAPPGVYIKSVTYGGTGCPQGSVGSLFSDDKTSLTLLFDSYVASAGPNVPITESRKNCQLAADIKVPQGWSYSVAKVDYRGFVNLPAKGTATQSSTYYFQASSQQYTASTNYAGPVNKDYLTSDTVPFQSLIWSDCKATVPVNINTKIKLTVPTGTQGLITTDSIDAKVTQIYGLTWKNCATGADGGRTDDTTTIGVPDRTDA